MSNTTTPIECQGPVDEDGMCSCYRACEACNAPEALYDAHGWFCQNCRDEDEETSP